MLAYPRQGVHLPVNALNDWGRSGRVLGKGIADAGTGAASLVQALERVEFTGDEADVARQLDEIARETTEELMESPVRDWDYSWQQAYAPRVQKLAEQYRGTARNRALQMAEKNSERYSFEGRKRLELERIRHSRQLWQEQVENAVRKGNADEACRWIERGREVFVPESGMTQRLEDTRSRSLHARWQKNLQQNPYETLVAWNNGTEERPGGEAERRELESEVERTRSNLFESTALQLAAAVEQGREPAEAEIERAVEAGVLPLNRMAELRLPRTPLTMAETCDWMRRIDERPDGQDGALMVDIAFAPIPGRERCMLLQRLKDTATLPSLQRGGVSQKLWTLYREGRLGCPGDTESLGSLRRLLQESLERQSAGGPQESAKWLSSLQQSTENWLCFQFEQNENNEYGNR